MLLNVMVFLDLHEGGHDGGNDGHGCRDVGDDDGNVHGHGDGNDDFMVITIPVALRIEMLVVIMIATTTTAMTMVTMLIHGATRSLPQRSVRDEVAVAVAAVAFCSGLAVERQRARC